jgi:hypothetical protein
VSGSQYNLIWTGSASNLWNYASVNWQSGGTSYTFDPGDNSTIASAATITVDAAEVAADTTTVGNATGTVSLDGGTLTTNSLVKSAAGLFAVNGNVAVGNGITLSGGTFQIDLPIPVGTSANISSVESLRVTLQNRVGSSGERSARACN